MTVKGEVHVGPWGSSGGAYAYEFKPNGKITKIYIREGDWLGCIDSIQFSYIPKHSKEEYLSPKYGGEGGHLQTMYIDRDEEIIELSGTVGSYDDWTVITSLCFKTNKKTCKFGSERGTRFSLPVKTNTKFVGFHGRYGAYVDSIGAILEPK